MQGKYTYSKKAGSQVKNIYIDTVKDWGITQADKYETGLEEILQMIADNPDMGRKCDAIHQGYQRHEYESHIIFYRR